MSIIFTIFSFIVLIGVVIFIHEFGHFIVARSLGIKVLKFSLGFGPKIVGRQIGDTEYVIAAIPLGGFVRLSGEDPEEELPEEEKAKSFSHQAVWKRLSVVSAGPIFNFLLAVVIFAGISMFVGVPIGTSKIGEVLGDSPADLAGIRSGDEIISISGVPIDRWEKIKDIIQDSKGRKLQIVLKREGSEITKSIVPKEESFKNELNDEFTEWRIGISSVIMRSYNPFSAIVLGVQETYHYVELTVIILGRIIQGRMASDNIGGPILIAQMAGQQAEKGMIPFVWLMALLSINLGVINLLPIPVLDGGHIFFFLIEGIRGKPISIKAREIAFQIGMFLIISLMVFAFYNDIKRLFI